MKQTTKPNKKNRESRSETSHANTTAQAPDDTTANSYTPRLKCIICGGIISDLFRGFDRCSDCLAKMILADPELMRLLDEM